MELSENQRLTGRNWKGFVENLQTNAMIHELLDHNETSNCLIDSLAGLYSPPQPLVLVS